MPKMLCALDFRLDRTLQIVLSSDAPEGLETFLKPLRKSFVPNKVVLNGKPVEPQKIRGLVSVGKGPLKGKPTAYVCEEGVCQKPVHSGEDLMAQIRGLRSPL